MVLRRDPAPSRDTDHPVMANEQPVTKRQRIESKSTGTEDTKAAPPDIIASPNGASTSSGSPPQTPPDEPDNIGARAEVRISPSFPDLLKVTPVDGELVDLHQHLMKQCLCGVSDRVMRRLFVVENGKKGALREWPAVKSMQFLSNIQLLFEVYLPQNIKGFVCLRILEACERLLQKDIALIDEITQLCDHDNRFIRFLAGRVLASFLLTAKKYMNVASMKLKPIVENFMALDVLDVPTMQRVAISAEILRRIVEWKDMEEHPLDEEDDEDEAPPQPPPLENNYFAAHYNPEMVAAATSSGTLRTPGAPHPVVRVTESGCQLVTVTDSESFDSGYLKFDMTEMLKEDWPSIVERMSTIIVNWNEMPGNVAEECIIAFLAFWESIISVRANLPIVQTFYFHEPLNDLRKLLSRDLPATVYKQMLTLFNESLCYGSTLALQDLLPKATCSFAVQSVLQVRRGWLVRSLPQERVESEVNFTGRRGQNVEYEEGTLVARVPTGEIRTMDKPLLQKLVLLVLKSVAVTAKEVRSDSSDSSIESTDFQAVQDIKTIEESIRDALKKLEDFMKNIMELHPETHFSNILVRLFDDQDDYLIEAMVCTLDVTVNMSFRNNAFPELVAMLNPVFTFLEFLKAITESHNLLLDLLISNETCFLLYLLRFLKYIRLNWSMFVTSCQESSVGTNCLEKAMAVLIRLRLQIQHLVGLSQFPYDIGPVLSLLRICEGLYDGDGDGLS